jgi:hypothetical protein
MLKVTLATEPSKKDISTCESDFRRETVAIAENFAENVYDTWTWTKNRMCLVLDSDITPSRHHAEAKQREYVKTGAEGIWDTSSQVLFSYIREHTPIVLEKVEDITCPNMNCRAKLKIYTNKIKGVRDAWDKFWIAKKTLLEIEKNSRIEALVNLARNARKKFKLVPDSTKCYDVSLNLLPIYKKQVFLEELTEKLDKIMENSIKQFVNAVIKGLPDMVDAECRCGFCKHHLHIEGD